LDTFMVAGLMWAIWRIRNTRWRLKTSFLKPLLKSYSLACLFFRNGGRCSRRLIGASSGCCDELHDGLDNGFQHFPYFGQRRNLNVIELEVPVGSFLFVFWAGNPSRPLLTL
jgi:hypothetical protein